MNLRQLTKKRVIGAVSAIALMLAAPVMAQTATGLDANAHLTAVASPAQSFSHTRLKNGVQVTVAGVTKNILFYSPTTVRVNANLGENHWKHPSIVIIDAPDEIVFEVAEDDANLIVTSEKLHLHVNKTTGAVTFKDALTGRIFTQEHQSAPQTIEGRTISDAPTYEVTNTFTLKPNEAIFGFGYTEADTDLNRRGKELRLVQTNLGIIIPVMMSSERYGILWDTYSQMRFTDTPEGAKLWAESAPGGVDYYFMAGDTMDEVVRGYRDLTGDAPMYPKQAFGLFMSKERYPTQARTVEVARTFREVGFPLDYIVQDWQYWGSDTDGTWSGMIWNPERFPDPKAMTDAIHGMNMKLMISIWPSVGNDTELARELDSKGLRFEPLHWISKKARIYDAFSPEGRRIYYKYVQSGLFDKGVDALWMDGTEVEVGTASWDADDNVRDIKSLGINAMGDFTRYLNPYTLMTTKGTYEGQRATNNKRVFTLTRSAWAGAQRTAAASWSGDTFASWKTFADQISGGVSVTITGNPYFTQDIGGFFVTQFPGGENNPAYRELFARWFQFGVFNPIMRVHGTSIEREPYIFKELDPPVYDSLLKAVNLRYRLLPYIYGLSWQVTSNDYTMMRALPMDFPTDTRTHTINDSFMFGPSLLIHPVTRAMYHDMGPPADTIPVQYLRTPDDKPGLAGQYFEGTNFDTPMGKTVDAELDFEWPGPPLAEIPGGLSSLDNFSARWEGFVIAPEDGEYEMGIEGDDGFRLFIDGTEVAGDWSNSANRYRSAKATFKAGQRVPIKVEYYQGGQDRALRLSWRTPSARAKLAALNTGTDLNVETYLPTGADWYDFWTGAKFTGGQSVKREAPLDIIPVYVRAGSIVPMGPTQQYATEKPDAAYEIRVYPGADATFTVYEDDNETYDYEKGAYAAYDLNWNDATRTLTIGARKGSYPGLTQSRELNIVVIIEGKGGADPITATRTVTYDGAETKLTF